MYTVDVKTIQQNKIIRALTQNENSFEESKHEEAGFREAAPE